MTKSNIEITIMGLEELDPATLYRLEAAVKVNLYQQDKRCDNVIIHWYPSGKQSCPYKAKNIHECAHIDCLGECHE
jgi:hypothetical protein